VLCCVGLACPGRLPLIAALCRLPFNLHHVHMSHGHEHNQHSAVPCSLPQSPVQVTRNVVHHTAPQTAHSPQTALRSLHSNGLMSTGANFLLTPLPSPLSRL
jgi:hypothetical protein